MRLRTTHTLATLPVSKETYNEIKSKLVEAEYQHTFIKTGSGEMIDMQGIALVEEVEVPEKECVRCGCAFTAEFEGIICEVCATKETEEIRVNKELSRKDKNYHVTEPKEI
jgi:hypothetical protein